MTEKHLQNGLKKMKIKYNSFFTLEQELILRNDVELFNKLNLDYSKEVWNLCVEYGLALVYASSAATYGNGSHGYSDSHAVVGDLKPTNPYGESKNNFDKWALEQEPKPYFWVGLKFFNVFGPNEGHKNRMASVVLHTFRQVSSTRRNEAFQVSQSKLSRRRTKQRLCLCRRRLQGLLST